VLGRSASDEALLRANDTIRKMFAYRHDVLKALIADGVKLVVLGKGETISDLPEYKGKEIKGLDRLLRSVEYSTETKTLVVDEANVLGELTDPLGSGCQVVRVMAKAMYRVTGLRPVDPGWESRPRGVWQQYELRVQRIDERFDQKLKELHERRSPGKWKGAPAIHGRTDYWTQGVMAYFDAVGAGASPVDAEHPIATREMLRDYDPELFAFVNETMGYKGKSIGVTGGRRRDAELAGGTSRLRSYRAARAATGAGRSRSKRSTKATSAVVGPLTSLAEDASLRARLCISARAGAPVRWTGRAATFAQSACVRSNDESRINRPTALVVSVVISFLACGFCRRPARTTPGRRRLQGPAQPALAVR